MNNLIFEDNIKINIEKSDRKLINGFKTKQELKELFYKYYTEKKLDKYFLNNHDEKDSLFFNHNSNECFKFSYFKSISRMYYFIWSQIDELPSIEYMQIVLDKVRKLQIPTNNEIKSFNKYIYIQTLIEMEVDDIINICLKKEIKEKTALLNSDKYINYTKNKDIFDIYTSIINIILLGFINTKNNIGLSSLSNIEKIKEKTEIEIKDIDNIIKINQNKLSELLTYFFITRNKLDTLIKNKEINKQNIELINILKKNYEELYEILKIIETDKIIDNNKINFTKNMNTVIIVINNLKQKLRDINFFNSDNDFKKIFSYYDKIYKEKEIYNIITKFIIKLPDITETTNINQKRSFFLNKRLIQMLPYQHSYTITQSGKKYKSYFQVNDHYILQYKLYIIYIIILDELYKKNKEDVINWENIKRGVTNIFLQSYKEMYESINSSTYDTCIERFKNSIKIYTDIDYGKLISEINKINNVDELTLQIFGLSLKDNYVYTENYGNLDLFYNNVSHLFFLGFTYGIGKMYDGRGGMYYKIFEEFIELFDLDNFIFFNYSSNIEEPEKIYLPQEYEIYLNKIIKLSETQHDYIIVGNNIRVNDIKKYNSLNKIKVYTKNEEKVYEVQFKNKYKMSVVISLCDGHAFCGLCNGKYCNDDEFTIKYYSDDMTLIKNFNNLEDTNDNVVAHCKLSKSSLVYTIYENELTQYKLNKVLEEFINNYTGNYLEYKKKYLKYKQKYLVLKNLYAVVDMMLR